MKFWERVEAAYERTIPVFIACMALACVYGWVFAPIKERQGIGMGIIIIGVPVAFSLLKRVLGVKNKEDD